MRSPDAVHRVSLDGEHRDVRAPRRFLVHGIFLAEFLPFVLPCGLCMSASDLPIYRFAGCELDPAERRLAVHGRAVTLTPKVFDTLVLLVERAGHVVSKDELMAALWPRGFVHESNLTKHIWLIRKALDDSEHDAHCIETVPKLGYRFIAPVERVAHAAAPVAFGAVPSANDATASANDALASADVVPIEARARAVPAPMSTPAALDGARARPSLRRVALPLGAALAVVALVAWLAVARNSGVVAPARSGTAVAIVDFSNLSQNAKDAWLGPALVEMLGIEIALGEHVYVLPDELVRPARADLSVPLAGGFAAQSLTTLRKRIGADYVLSGSYLVSGDPNAPVLRLDLALQDARSSTSIANISQSGAVADLSALVTRSGTALRSEAGLRPASAAEQQSLANAQPPTSDVARRMGFALDALHRNDPARARDELLDAIAQAPGYAPAYSYLAQAWAALGYGAKASAAAEQAAAHAENLPEEQRLQIEMQRYATQHDWAHAAARGKALVAMRPEDPNYRLHLIASLLAGNERAEAIDALAALERQPGAADDPRVALAAADIAGNADDSEAAAKHARRALEIATRRDAPGLIADAKLRLGMALFHLGDEDGAQTVLREAIAAYQHDGNPHGEAFARDALGKSLAAANRIVDAREEYQRALAILEGIGDLGGLSTTYSDLSRMLWMSGDRDGAEAAARKVRDVSIETGNAIMQAWSLQALATAASDEAAGDDVVRDYEDIIALQEKNRNEGGLVWALGNYADVLRMRGEFDKASAVCARAGELAAHITDPQFAILISFGCGELALDRGDVPAALNGFRTAHDKALASGDTMELSNVELERGEIDRGHRQYASAATHFETAADGFAKGEAAAGEADAAALLALMRDQLGDAPARDRAVERARAVRGRITERQEVFAVDLVLASLQARSGDAKALERLRELSADAERRHWRNWWFESRLALVDALAFRNDPSAAKQRAELEAAARAQGFGWIVQRLGNDRAETVASRH